MFDGRVHNGLWQSSHRANAFNIALECVPSGLKAFMPYLFNGNVSAKIDRHYCT
jgi:hypothetical protein